MVVRVKRTNLLRLAVLLAVIVVGGVLLHVGRAATPFLTAEPETGTPSAGATVGSDATASNGKYVTFPAPAPGITPYGVADYCALEGTSTVIYGWAYDPDAGAAVDPTVTVTINGVTKTVPTDQAGYRDAAINAWIDTNRAGNIKPGTYGFRAVFSGLSKSTVYTISGTIINIGGGTNANLNINDDGLLDGAATNSFIGKTLPINCLSGTAGTITKACSNNVPLPTKYDHVLWIYEENHTFSQVINSTNAPYITNLAKTCGSTSQFHDGEPSSEQYPDSTTYVYHSFSEYIAYAAGSLCQYGNGIHGTGCWATLTSTQKHNLTWKSVFQQVNEAGGTWREYDESADMNCDNASHGLYHDDHNPSRMYTDVRSQCATNDIAIPPIVCPDGAGKCNTAPTGRLATDIASGNLPTYGLIIPNVDNMMHDGTVNQADTWMKTYLTPLFNSAEYKKGRTAVFVIWDEGNSNTSVMPFLAISPSTKAGIVTNPINGFAVLRATEEMLGITEYLGCASGTPPHAVGQAPPAGSSCFSGATAKIRSIYKM